MKLTFFIFAALFYLSSGVYANDSHGGDESSSEESKADEKPIDRANKIAEELTLVSADPSSSVKRKVAALKKELAAIVAEKDGPSADRLMLRSHFNADQKTQNVSLGNFFVVFNKANEHKLFIINKTTGDVTVLSKDKNLRFAGFNGEKLVVVKIEKNASILYLDEDKIGPMVDVKAPGTDARVYSAGKHMFVITKTGLKDPSFVYMLDGKHLKILLDNPQK